MVTGHRTDESVRSERPRRRLVQVAGLALGMAALGATGLTGTLAQTDDAVAASGGASVFGEAFPGGVEDFVNSILAEVFGSVPAVDEADVSGGGDINVGGNVGGNITMGGSSGGGITVGGADSGGYGG